MGNRTLSFTLLLSLLVGLGFFINVLLAPSISSNVPYESNALGTLCKWCAILLPALYAYRRPLGLRAIAVALAAVLGVAATLEILGAPLPLVLFHGLYYFGAGLSITASGLMIYLMAARDIRGGVALGFAISALLMVLMRSLTALPTTAVRPYAALIYAGLLLAVAFGTSKGRTVYPSARRQLEPYGGIHRFGKLLFAASSESRLVIILGTVLVGILGVFSHYAEVIGAPLASSNAALIGAFAMLMALFALSLHQKTGRYFYTVFLVIMAGCILMLLAVILFPQFIQTLSGGFGVMQMLTLACVCAYTLEFSKDQQITPVFTCATLPLLVDVARFAGESLDALYGQLFPAQAHSIAPVAAMALAIIALAAIAALVCELSNRDNRLLGIGEAQQRSIGETQQSRPTPPSDEHQGEQMQLQLVRQYGLTRSEVQVVLAFAAGMTATAISEQRVVSNATVKTQLKRAYAKLDVHSRQELEALVAAIARSANAEAAAGR